MATSIPDVTRRGVVDGIVDLLNTTGGTVKIYPSPVVDVDTVASGELVSIPLGANPFGAATDSGGNLATASLIATPSATATVTDAALWYRAYDSGGAAVIQGSCGTSGEDMTLNTLSIVVDGTVTINTWDVTCGQAQT